MFYTDKTNEVMQISAKNRYVITLDDNPMVSKIIERIIGVQSIGYTSAKALLQDLSKYRPMAIFVDVSLGADDPNGIQMVPLLRQRYPDCPILVITADGGDDIVERALAAGADDFVRKPPQPKELMARFQARLHDRAQKHDSAVIRYADIALDCIRGVIRAHGKEFKISKNTTAFLSTLMESNGTVVTRESLRQKVWGAKKISQNAVDKAAQEVREAVEQASRTLTLTAVYGKGFHLIRREEKEERPQQPTVAKKESILNQEKIDSLLALSSEESGDLLSELCEMFLSGAPEVHQSIRTGVEEKHGETTAKAAHKLKGMCLNIGADSLAALCEQMQSAAKAEDFASCGKLLTAYEELYDKVVRALQPYVFRKAA